jgi:hypothetical protein
MGAAKTIAGRHAGNIDIVLDGDRDAVEGSQTRLALSSEGCLLGVCLRLVPAQDEVAVERAADTRGARQINVEQVARVKFASLNAPRQLGYRQKRQLVHGTLRLGR